MKDLNRLNKHCRAAVRAIRRKWALIEVVEGMGINNQRLNALLRCAPTCGYKVFRQAVVVCLDDAGTVCRIDRTAGRDDPCII